jgi:LPS O-antigen subunit length determinant protein (WzzB/FepE family)
MVRLPEDMKRFAFIDGLMGGRTSLWKSSQTIIIAVLTLIIGALAMRFLGLPAH